MKRYLLGILVVGTLFLVGAGTVLAQATVPSITIYDNDAWPNGISVTATGYPAGNLFYGQEGPGLYGYVGDIVNSCG